MAFIKCNIKSSKSMRNIVKDFNYSSHPYVTVLAKSHLVVFLEQPGLKNTLPPKPLAKFWKSTTPGCIRLSLPNMDCHPVWDNTQMFDIQCLQFVQNLSSKNGSGQILVTLVEINRWATRAVTQGWFKKIMSCCKPQAESRYSFGNFRVYLLKESAS